MCNDPCWGCIRNVGRSAHKRLLDSRHQQWCICIHIFPSQPLMRAGPGHSLFDPTLFVNPVRTQVKGLLWRDLESFARVGIRVLSACFGLVLRRMQVCQEGVASFVCQWVQSQPPTGQSLHSLADSWCLRSRRYLRRTLSFGSNRSFVRWQFELSLLVQQLQWFRPSIRQISC
jgi:hypothetical protein